MWRFPAVRHQPRADDDKATIAGVTYDFVVRGSGFHKKDWTTNPGNRPHYIHATP